MDEGLNKCLEYLALAIKETRLPVRSIRPAMDYYKIGDREYQKEVAEIEFENGTKRYADIGGDSNLAAIYDVVAVLMDKKPRSKVIERIEYIAEDLDELPFC